jgi:hypothetical protein
MTPQLTVRSQSFRLSPSIIETAPRIVRWVDQFNEDDRPAVRQLLLGLRMITRDMYARWVKKMVESLPEGCHALYAVRDVDHEHGVYSRSGQSQGSEDFVFSLISQLMRSGKEHFLDNPTLDEMKDAKVRNICLIDDSSGSGENIASFVRWMFESKTLRSWWSYGWINFYIVVLFRSSFSTGAILEAFPGTDHHRRVRPRRTKVHLYSDWIYGDAGASPAWGRSSEGVHLLCAEYGRRLKLRCKFRLGYGEQMSPYLFEHGVPNNVPGILYHDNDKRGWHALFPGKTVPADLVAAFQPAASKGEVSSADDTEIEVEAPSFDKHVLHQLLTLANKGVRTKTGIASRMGCDASYAGTLQRRAVDIRLIDDRGRLTDAGRSLLRTDRRGADSGSALNEGLYVPKSWRTDQEEVQPSSGITAQRDQMADFKGLVPLDGDAQASLEETDARVAQPPPGVRPHEPTRPGVRPDASGPSD